MQSGGMRNENVAVNLIDNNAIKELNQRLGAMISLLAEPRSEAGLYASQFGRTGGGYTLGALSRPSTWHGEMQHQHQNSVFNARTFFQSGPVKPSRRNIVSAQGAGALGPATWLTVGGTMRRIRGMVNGNVLVPLAGERTALTNDPQLRPLIERFLNAYPRELPNRPDFDARALNTNAPQVIDGVEGLLRLDQDLGGLGRLSVSHQLTRESTDAFQLVAGQNPDAALHSHRGQITWRRDFGPRTSATTGFLFNRTRSVFDAEPNAMPFRVRVGYQIEELGPDGEFPLNRALTSFRYGGSVTHRAGGSHQLIVGGDFTRYRHNGIETANSRGFFSFTNNFGRGAIENLRLGTPSFYETTLGELNRGFRRWAANAFLGDRWTIARRVSLYYGVRYNLVTAPTEVNGYHPPPYGADLNNVSPRWGLAVDLGRGWMLRQTYTVSFDEIPPVTYQQVRFNLPHVRNVQIQNPSLLNPLGGLSLQSAGRSSPTIMAGDLVSPYEHHGGLSLERKLAGGAMLRLGYVASRGLKAMNTFITNRGGHVPGIRETLDTVDARRADPRFYEVRYVVNGGLSTFNAGQASLDVPNWRGLRGNVSYTFGKSIDEGSDYTSTAANRDMTRARAQSEPDSFNDRKGLSNFDSTHSISGSYSYDLPRLAPAASWIGRWVANGWQLAGSALAKTGTPLTLFIGSDAPGFGNVDGGSSDRPHILDPSILGKTIRHPDVAPVILRRDRFGYLRPGEDRGSLGRNTLRKARIANWNAALSRQFDWGQAREWRLQFRAEVYNLTNTPQFDEPQRNLTSPAFGKITNALNDGRVFQFGLRLML